MLWIIAAFIFLFIFPDLALWCIGRAVLFFSGMLIYSIWLAGDPASRTQEWNAWGPFVFGAAIAFVVPYIFKLLGNAHENRQKAKVARYQQDRERIQREASDAELKQRHAEWARTEAEWVRQAARRGAHTAEDRHRLLMDDFAALGRGDLTAFPRMG